MAGAHVERDALDLLPGCIQQEQRLPLPGLAARHCATAHRCALACEPMARLPLLAGLALTGLATTALPTLRPPQGIPRAAACCFFSDAACMRRAFHTCARKPKHVCKGSFSTRPNVQSYAMKASKSAQQGSSCSAAWTTFPVWELTVLSTRVELCLAMCRQSCQGSTKACITY